MRVCNENLLNSDQNPRICLRAMRPLSLSQCSFRDFVLEVVYLEIAHLAKLGTLQDTCRRPVQFTVQPCTPPSSALTSDQNLLDTGITTAKVGHSYASRTRIDFPNGISSSNNTVKKSCQRCDYYNTAAATAVWRCRTTLIPAAGAAPLQTHDVDDFEYPFRHRTCPVGSQLGCRPNTG